MKKLSKPLVLLAMFLGIWACGSDDPEVEPTAMLSINTTGAEVNESVGTFSIDLNLDGPTDSDVMVEFVTTGSAVLNGDYRITTPSPIIIPAGNTTASLALEIIDDPVVERYEVIGETLELSEDKEIILTLRSGNGLLNIPSDQNQITLSIGDNDLVPSSGLQTDLLWSLGPGMDMNEVNLDMYFITDVTTELGQITNFRQYGEGARSESGFESLSLNTNDPDNEYYLVVEYTEGTEVVEFELFSYLPDGILYARERLSGTDNDAALVFGPFLKEGNNITSVRAPELDLQGALRPFSQLN